MANYQDAPLADQPQANQPQAFTSVLGPGVPYSGVAESARAVGQGLTFGFLDELPGNPEGLGDRHLHCEIAFIPRFCITKPSILP